jgi:hypothetical protein
VDLQNIGRSCAIEHRRRGWTQTYSFSMKDAHRADLLSSDPAGER